MMEITSLRTVTVRSTGKVYIQKESVIDLLLDLSAAEETDTRRRIEELVGNLERNIQPAGTTRKEAE